METRIYRRLQKRNRIGSGSYHWKPHINCINTKIQLYIHSRNQCNAPSSEYNISNKRKELPYIHRLEKLPASALKASSDHTAQRTYRKYGKQWNSAGYTDTQVFQETKSQTKKSKEHQDVKNKQWHASINTCFHILMMSYIRNGTQSGMRRMTSSKK